MIITCGKCGTKFRFEETVIEGDGVWVRCSRCRHVFFQENINREEKTVLQPEADHTPDVLPVQSRGEEIGDVMEEDLGMAVKEFDALEDLAEEESGETAETGASIPASEKKKSIVGKIFAYLFLFLLIVLLLGGIYLWAVPEDRQKVTDFLASTIPIFENISMDQRLHGQVALQDVRQHFVNNWLMGNMRVLEGAAVNTSEYSLTRIQVRGKLYDAGGGMVGERVSFCGNLLTDAELTTLTEEEIQRRLSQPSGSNAPAPYDRVRPHGQIPFMIVFPRDPPAVAKATVMVAGVEKLLE